MTITLIGTGSLDVDALFIDIVGILSRDREMRNWAAFGSAALSENDDA